ncbi:hypothetical protein Trydic_g19422 [Trypoxylus dichotomus]
MFRQRIFQSSNLIFLISLLVVGGILFQIRTLYNNHQRHLRIQAYTKDVMKLSEEMNVIHKVANTSMGLLRKLEHYVNEDMHKYKHKLS